MKKIKKIKKVFYVIILEVLFVYSIFITWIHIIDKKYKNIIFNTNLNENIDNKNKVFINNNYFIDNFNLKNYSETEFKITDEGKKIINSIRNLHKSESIIWEENADKDLCAGYLWILTEKIWWKNTPYHIWMMNTKTRTPSKAWELPYFYQWFWWDILIDLWDKFSVNKKDYFEKIKENDFKMFFKSAFLEEALFWDIWFLYKETGYTEFLNLWSANSHITKNMWISNFEFIVWKDYENNSDLDIISDVIGCSKEVSSNFYKVLENYKLYLNDKRIVFNNWDFYYLNADNSLWNKIKLKYLDKITYDDITLTHYFQWRSRVNSLFDMTCSWDFFPINVISINKRMIEKM